MSLFKLYGFCVWVELLVYKYNVCLCYIEIWCFIYYIIVVLFIDMYVFYDFMKKRMNVCFVWYGNNDIIMLMM